MRLSLDIASSNAGAVDSETVASTLSSFTSAVTVTTSPPVLSLFSDVAGSVTLSGSNVTNWADQSGAAHDAAQATGGLQPTYSASGFGSASAPFLLFDGTDDNLSIADHADFEFGNGTYAIFLALRFIVGTSFRTPFSKGSDSAGSGWRCFRNGATNALILFPNGGTNYVASGLTLANGTDAPIMFGYDAVDAKVLYAQGSSRERTAQTDVSIPDTANAVKIGRDNTPSYASNVRIAAILVFKRSSASHFTDAEVAMVQTFLQNRFGI